MIGKSLIPNLEPGVRTLFQLCPNKHIPTRIRNVWRGGQREREGGREEGRGRKSLRRFRFMAHDR